MNKGLFIWAFVLLPAVLFSQNKVDSVSDHESSKGPELNKRDGSAEHPFILMFNASTVFYTTQDPRINKFLNKYGYTPPQNVPMGLRIEIAGMPNGGKMIYSLNAGTVVSKQDISTADLLIGAYHRVFETKKLWILGGLALGEHFDRIVLSGNLPPSLDSLAKKYNTTLSLRRNGFIAEPAIKIFWYPLKTKNYQLGLYAGIYYDLDFNSKWRVGYDPDNDNSFKNLRKPTSVSTEEEFGWVFSTGISICF
jgi:hypothetical protein